MPAEREAQGAKQGRSARKIKRAETERRPGSRPAIGLRYFGTPANEAAVAKFPSALQSRSLDAITLIGLGFRLRPPYRRPAVKRKPAQFPFPAPFQTHWRFRPRAPREADDKPWNPSAGRLKSAVGLGGVGMFGPEACRPEEIVYVFFMEEREEPSDGNCAERSALRIDHGDIRVVPLDGQQRDGLGIRFRSDFQGDAPRRSSNR